MMLWWYTVISHRWENEDDSICSQQSEWLPILQECNLYILPESSFPLLTKELLISNQCGPLREHQVPHSSQTFLLLCNKTHKHMLAALCLVAWVWYLWEAPSLILHFTVILWCSFLPCKPLGLLLSLSAE